jgi:hypothetical protein
MRAGGGREIIIRQRGIDFRQYSSAQYSSTRPGE